MNKYRRASGLSRGRNVALFIERLESLPRTKSREQGGDRKCYRVVPGRRRRRFPSAWCMDSRNALEAMLGPGTDATLAARLPSNTITQVIALSVQLWSVFQYSTREAHETILLFDLLFLHHSRTRSVSRPTFLDIFDQIKSRPELLSPFSMRPPPVH